MKVLTLVLTLVGTLLFAEAIAQSKAQCCSVKKTASSTLEQSDPKEVATIKLKITGMTCAGCANHVHKALSETAGVLDNSVEYPGNIAVIKYNPDKTKPALIIEAIETKTSYKAELVQDEASKKS